MFNTQKGSGLVTVIIIIAIAVIVFLLVRGGSNDSDIVTPDTQEPVVNEIQGEPAPTTTEPAVELQVEADANAAAAAQAAANAQNEAMITEGEDPMMTETTPETTPMQ